MTYHFHTEIFFTAKVIIKDPFGIPAFVNILLISEVIYPVSVNTSVPLRINISFTSVPASWFSAVVPVSALSLLLSLRFISVMRNIQIAVRIHSGCFAAGKILPPLLHGRNPPESVRYFIITSRFCFISNRGETKPYSVQPRKVASAPHITASSPDEYSA